MNAFELRHQVPFHGVRDTRRRISENSASVVAIVVRIPMENAVSDLLEPVHVTADIHRPLRHHLTTVVRLRCQRLHDGFRARKRVLRKGWYRVTAARRDSGRCRVGELVTNSFKFLVSWDVVKIVAWWC